MELLDFIKLININWPINVEKFLESVTSIGDIKLISNYEFNESSSDY